MRLIKFTSLLVIGLGCTSPKHSTMKSNSLNGTWIPVKQEIGGTSLPPAAYSTQKLIIDDSLYTFVAESTEKGVVKYNGDKMDIYGKDGVNAGKHFTAIYKFDSEQLTICYNLSGNNYPETFDTKGKPAFFLSIFKKETTK